MGAGFCCPMWRTCSSAPSTGRPVIDGRDPAAVSIEVARSDAAEVGVPSASAIGRHRRPGRHSVHPEMPGGRPRNVGPDAVPEITATGSHLRILVTSSRAPDPVAEITPGGPPNSGPADGTSV